VRPIHPSPSPSPSPSTLTHTLTLTLTLTLTIDRARRRLRMQLLRARNLQEMVAQGKEARESLPSPLEPSIGAAAHRPPSAHNTPADQEMAEIDAIVGPQYDCATPPQPTLRPPHLCYPRPLPSRVTSPSYLPTPRPSPRGAHACARSDGAPPLVERTASAAATSSPSPRTRPRRADEDAENGFIPGVGARYVWRSFWSSRQ
jgi:hypothetical protein